jgi:hypothetical protein
MRAVFYMDYLGLAMLDMYQQLYFTDCESEYVTANVKVFSLLSFFHGSFDSLCMYAGMCAGKIERIHNFRTSPYKQYRNQLY